MVKHHRVWGLVASWYRFPWQLSLSNDGGAVFVDNNGGVVGTAVPGETVTGARVVVTTVEGATDVVRATGGVGSVATGNGAVTGSTNNTVVWVGASRKEFTPVRPAQAGWQSRSARGRLDTDESLKYPAPLLGRAACPDFRRCPRQRNQRKCEGHSCMQIPDPSNSYAHVRSKGPPPDGGDAGAGKLWS